jgi:hypothetical protein
VTGAPDPFRKVNKTEPEPAFQPEEDERGRSDPARGARHHAGERFKCLAAA